MPTASELRGIHAAHEAGMHDKKRKPEVCKMCAREDKEATEVAKQRTQCQCGGTFDGTPSGRKAHDKTAKHRDWSAGQMAAAVAARHPVGGFVDRPLASEVVEEAQEIVDRVETGAQSLDGDENEVVEALGALIVEKSRERDRRVVDHKWRVANRPKEAPAYFASKVEPLLREIETLQLARTTLQEALRK